VIILDTNVLSALMRDEPDRRVVTWLDGQAAASTWITSVTVFEVRLGLALVPEGRRRHTLEQAFDCLLDEDLDGRILSFDKAAATEAAALAAIRERAGTRSISATPRSRASPWPDEHPSPPATCAISKD
jgi:hypothetical protein